MAAGAFTLFNKSKPKLTDGTFDLDGHTLKAMLVTNAQSLAATFTGTSTDCRYSDITAQVANGNGYTTGGVTLTSVTLTESGGTVTFDAADFSWSGATFEAKYVVIYDDTATNKPLLCFADLNTSSSVGLSPSNGTLSVPIHANGIFTYA